MITLARWEGCGPGPTAPGKLDDDDNDKDDNMREIVGECGS